MSKVTPESKPPYTPAIAAGLFLSAITSDSSSKLFSLPSSKVIFIPFANGKPSGKPEDFLTGFIDELSQSEVHGRPVGIAILEDGSMLVSDDVSNIIWRISAVNK